MTTAINAFYGATAYPWEEGVSISKSKKQSIKMPHREEVEFIDWQAGVVGDPNTDDGEGVIVRYKGKKYRVLASRLGTTP